MRSSSTPPGKFVIGGPVGDAGLTGRKIIVDTYGGRLVTAAAPSRARTRPRSTAPAAYATRWVAKNLVAAGAADRCEVQVAYAIGVARPVSVMVETFGTENVDPAKIAGCVNEVFDLRPGRILDDLKLRNPIYAVTAAYGHFGREDGDSFTWENTDRVDQVKAALGL